MRFRPNLALILAFVSCAISCLAMASELALVPDLDGSNHVEMKDLGNGEWEIRTTGNDPYFYLRTGGGAIDLARQPIFSFDCFSATGIGRMLVFVGPVLSVPHMITVTDVGRREGWGPCFIDMTTTLEPATEPVTSLRVTVGEGPGAVARFRGFKARPATGEERRLAQDREERLANDRKLTERLRSYLLQEFPNQITSVSANGRKITIRGKIAGSAENLQLAEIPMWDDITNLKSPAALHPVNPGESGDFSIIVDRDSVAGREILLSAWALVRKTGDTFEPVSAMRYVEDQVPRADLPAANPRSLKGIGGCAFDHPDMQELGIASVTLNIILNEILSPDPGPGKSPYSFAGRTWHVNESVVARHDHDMRIAASNGWMVSAIILLPPVRQSPQGTWIRDAAHPEADPGSVFVMPNLTSQAGVNAYAAAMNFIAERYSRPDNRYGRIHHWIMHNEINSGFFWTSAGNKTDLTYMDLYQKSMRVSCILARQYDPHAKPLISLDHCWTHRSDLRGYTARDLLDHLVAFSHKEGDFPWGIAFHPYPQDIFNPRTWEDSEATFSFSTPFITCKNIEVLDAWARQPKVAYRGQPREIQLTEQGFNSPDYSEKSLADQAAGMAYAWEKIERLKTITAFQYHLWADDRGEGGLRLGLRKFGDDLEAPHGVKPIWNVYKAIGTNDWEQASDIARSIVAIRTWDEIRYTGKISDK